jgi:hypothetical protein
MDIRCSDCLSVLRDEGFLANHARGIDLFFGDVPFGYFKDDPNDIIFDEKSRDTICSAAYRVLSDTGVVALRMNLGQIHDWTTSLKRAGLLVQRDPLVLIEQETWVKTKTYVRYGVPVNPLHYVLIGFKRPDRQHYEALDRFGTLPCVHARDLALRTCHAPSQHLSGSLSTGRFPKNSRVMVEVPHLANRWKLTDEEGRTLRIQETHLNELCELIHMYCPQNGRMLDFCAGTLSSVLACLLIGRSCIAIERDPLAVDHGTRRAEHFVLSYTNEGYFPVPGVTLMSKYDGTDLYDWMRRALKIKPSKKVHII